MTASKVPGYDVEIEHRYLLSSPPQEVTRLSRDIVYLRQLYLVTDNIVERFSCREYIRHPIVEPGTKRWTRTIKIGHGLERLEFKDDTHFTVFETLWNSRLGKRLCKLRHRITEGGLTWETDVFLDRNLYLAEVEVPSADYKVEKPEWLQLCCVREVTEELDYEGAQLALWDRDG